MNAPAQIDAPLRLLTFDEWFAKWEESEQRVELIDGEEILLPSDGALHTVFRSNTLYIFQKALREANLWDDFRAYANPTLKLSGKTGVIPDVGIFPAGVLESGVLGSWETILLAVEISDTSLSCDQGRKTGTYARHGLQELWIKRVKTRDVLVRRGLHEGVYADDFTRTAGQTISPMFAPELTIAVDDLFAL